MYIFSNILLIAARWDDKLTLGVIFVIIIRMILSEQGLATFRGCFFSPCGNSEALTLERQLTLGRVIDFSALNWLQHGAYESKACLEF